MRASGHQFAQGAVDVVLDVQDVLLQARAVTECCVASLVYRVWLYLLKTRSHIGLACPTCSNKICPDRSEPALTSSLRVP